MVDISARDYSEDIRAKNKDYFPELRIERKKEKVEEKMMNLNIDLNKKKYKKEFLMLKKKEKVIKAEMKVEEKEKQCTDIKIS